MTRGGHSSSDRVFMYLSIAPLVVVLTLLTVYPGERLVALSLSNVKFESGHLKLLFVGLKNFLAIGRDPTVAVAALNTLLIVVVSVVAETILGLLLAVVAGNLGTRGVAYRPFIMVPMLIPPIAVGAIWFLLYNTAFGGIDQLLAVVGIQGPDWLGAPRLALWSVVLVDIWHWTSFMFLLLFAGIQALPGDVNEAARIDGASESRIFFQITLPLLRPVLAVAVMLRAINASKIFDEVFLLTSGGPGTHTQVVSLYIEQVFFGEFHIGYASALALSMGIIVAIFVATYRKVMMREQG